MLDLERPRTVTRRWWSLAVVCMAMFMGVLDSTSVYAALPEIALDLGFAPAEVQWVVTAYGVAIGGLLLLGGRLADLLGRRRVFMAAVGLFAVSSAACGLAWSSEVLIAARVLQGIGAAVMTPAGLSILMNVFPDGPDRHKALGIWGGLGGVGASAGLLLGGVLTDGPGWAWIFLMNVPVSLVVLSLSRVLLPEGAAHGRRRPDVAGAVTITAALTLALLALFRVAEDGPDLAVLAFGAGAVVSAAAFVVVERRSPAPLVPRRILASRTRTGGNLVVVVAGIAVDGLLIVVTLFAQQVLGFSAIQFGLTTATMTVASVLSVMVGQRLVTRSGFRLVATAGLSLLAVACVLLSRLSPAGVPVDLLPGLTVFGAGLGAAFVAGQIAALAGAGERDAGLAAGLEETSFAIGTTTGAALASAVAVGYATRRSAGPPSVSALTEGFELALLTLAGVAALGAVLAGVLLRAARAGVR